MKLILTFVNRKNKSLRKPCIIFVDVNHRRNINKKMVFTKSQVFVGLRLPEYINKNNTSKKPGNNAGLQLLILLLTCDRASLSRKQAHK